MLIRNTISSLLAVALVSACGAPEFRLPDCSIKDKGKTQSIVFDATDYTGFDLGGRRILQGEEKVQLWGNAGSGTWRVWEESDQDVNEDDVLQEGVPYSWKDGGYRYELMLKHDKFWKTPHFKITTECE